MENNNKFQSENNNKQSIPPSPTTPTSIATTSKKTKHFISPNRYSALAEPDPVPAASTCINNDNQIDFDTQSQHSSTHTQKKKDLQPPIFIKDVINFSQLRNAFLDLTGLNRFNCNSTSTHLKLQLNAPDNYKKQYIS